MTDKSSEMSTKTFLGPEGFCPHCGCILPVNASKGRTECFVCKHTFDLRKARAEAIQKQKEEKNRSARAEGPVVERQCLKCGNNKMTYSTLQLRSADEGQTVFYSCLNCGHKETENS